MFTLWGQQIINVPSASNLLVPTPLYDGMIMKNVVTTYYIATTCIRLGSRWIPMFFCVHLSGDQAIGIDSTLKLKHGKFKMHISWILDKNCVDTFFFTFVRKLHF